MYLKYKDFEIHYVFFRPKTESTPRSSFNTINKRGDTATTILLMLYRYFHRPALNYHHIILLVVLYSAVQYCQNATYYFHYIIKFQFSYKQFLINQGSVFGDAKLFKNISFKSVTMINMIQHSSLILTQQLKTMEENNKKQICHKCCHKYILLRVIVKVYNNSVHRLNMVCSMAWIQYTFIRISFRHIKSFIRFRLAFVFGLQTL